MCIKFENGEFLFGNYLCKMSFYSSLQESFEITDQLVLGEQSFGSNKLEKEPAGLFYSKSHLSGRPERERKSISRFHELNLGIGSPADAHLLDEVNKVDL